MRTIVKFCGGCMDGREADSHRKPDPNDAMSDANLVLGMCHEGEIGRKFMTISPAALDELRERSEEGGVLTLTGTGAQWHWYEVTNDSTDGATMTRTVVLTAIPAPDGQ